MMTVNERREFIPVPYVMDDVPTIGLDPINDPLHRFAQEQFRLIQESLNSIARGTLQVADQEPREPLRGMIRINKLPWDPLKNGSEGIIAYNGSGWAALGGERGPTGPQGEKGDRGVSGSGSIRGGRAYYLDANATITKTGEGDVIIIASSADSTKTWQAVLQNVSHGDKIQIKIHASSTVVYVGENTPAAENSASQHVVFAETAQIRGGNVWDAADLFGLEGGCLVIHGV